MDKFLAALRIKFTTIASNLNKNRRGNPLKVVYTTKVEQGKVYITFHNNNQQQCVSIKAPHVDGYGNCVIGERVQRAVGSWQFKDIEYSYWQLMTWILTGRAEEAFPQLSKKSQLERIILSFETGLAPVTVRSFQELVDGIINRLPLTGTPMETWAMCNRIVFLDPSFNSLAPKEALAYQKELNIKHFPWTSVGLSDSGMCNNNLLKTDLRKYTPFGLKHHNPMRNLYQTLGMRGREQPHVQTESMALLQRDRGVQRMGWNLMTCFLDTPLNFEDQLIVDNRHLDKFTLENKRFACFGDVKVLAGDDLSGGDVISIEPNGKALSFWVRADRAMVVDISKDTIVFNGREREVTIVSVETKHMFKEGIKLTNCHGNKGVVTFADCGHMHNDDTGQDVPIDIIVSAKTISKRKNYGQVLEVLLTLLNGDKTKTIIPDNAEIKIEQLKKSLSSRGFREDGTSTVQTQWLTGQAICGWGFWGLIKNPESQLWTRSEVTAVDNRGRRTAGTKISHIEFKGLTTIFGPKSPIVDEILTHQQGFEDVHELVQVLETMRGQANIKAVLDWSAIKPLVQGENYFHTSEELVGTITDPELLSEGFMLEIPLIYHIYTPTDTAKSIEYQLLLSSADLRTAAKPAGDNVFLNRIYVPHTGLRECWQHSTGLWGVSDIGGYLNNIVIACHELDIDDDTSSNKLLRNLNKYYEHVSRRLSTKKGEISTYALAVRYPHSVKATATLAKEGLPSNWVEIHANMARDLNVRDGDYVIAERFPCLGFKSLRIQRVRVTTDPQCEYVIRVSGNSLVSQNLDFDGDVLFLMSFQTQESNEALSDEFNNPNTQRIKYIEDANACKIPTTAPSCLDTVNLCSFDELTAEKQSEIVGSLTGTKRGTGAIVALAYNMMRIIENNVGFKDKGTNLALEVIMDTVANSVFGQKHAGVSLEDCCKEAICTADVNMMLGMGFPKEGSHKLCSIIKEEAKTLGVYNLKEHYQKHIEEGKSNIVNVIIRNKHKFYFATRSNLGPIRLLQHIEQPATDLTAHLWKRSLKLKENNDLRKM